MKAVTSFLALALSASATAQVGIGTTTPQAQLHTTGTIRMDTLAGTGTRLVFADADGRVFSQRRLPFVNDVPGALTLDGCASSTPVLRSITVTGLAAPVPSANIKVRVNITHVWNEDVHAILTAPNGATLVLLAGQGYSGDNFTNTVLWDGAAAPVTTGASSGNTGNYKPRGLLSTTCFVVPTVSTFGAIGGGSIVPNGVWTLRVFDASPSDNGSLINWAISFEPGAPAFEPQVVGPFTSGTVPRGTVQGGLVPGALFDNGNIGIGTTSPNAPLQFSNAAQARKVVLYEAANNDHQFSGFGTGSAILRYQTEALASDHVFYSAESATASRELMRVTGTGEVGIGEPVPAARLHVKGGPSSASTGLFTASFGAPNGILRAERTSTPQSGDIAVLGICEAATTAGTTGTGVEGRGNLAGVEGNGATTANSPTYGVRGFAYGASGAAYGVYGIASTSAANNIGTKYGVYGAANSGATNWAGYFSGNVQVTGTLSKGSGTFKIDHPQDPENKYLYHSFVESPDMMNVYNGNIVLDAAGEATVELPAYFEALNKDFRYQLTPIGAPAQLYVADEISGNHFRIAGGTAGVKVSWQVTGVRKDKWAEHNRVVPVVDKAAEDKGTYLHPAAWGQPQERGEDWKHQPPPPSGERRAAESAHR